MDTTIISTRHGPLRKAMATNSTVAGTAVAQPADVMTSPYATDGYHVLGRGGSRAPNALIVYPYGVGNNDTTFLLGIFAVERIINKTSTALPAEQWTHKLLASFTCTNSTAVGLAGGIVVATERYCDTIVVIAGNTNISHEAVSPTDNRGGHIIVDVKGAEGVFFSFFMNSSSTSANALFKPL